MQADYPTLFEQAQGGTSLLKEFIGSILLYKKKLLHLIQQLTKKHTNQCKTDRND